MKRYFYIFAFGFLGLLVSLLLHALIEIPTLALITGEAGNFGDNVVWRHWRFIHGVGGQGLFLVGMVTGLLLGRKFWHILYVEQRYGKPRW